MRSWSLSHLSDEAFDREFHASLRRHDESTAVVLARTAEFDARKRFLPAGYGSMWDYCIEFKRLSEDVTSKRLQAARAAWAHPVIFAMLADGRLTQCSVNLLAPHLTPENAEDLLAKASGLTKAKVLDLLAERSRPAPATRLDAAATTCAENPHATSHVSADATPLGLGPKESDLHATSHVAVPEWQDVPLNLRIDQETHQHLRYAQALLSHTKDYRDVGEVFKRALKALVTKLETKKFGGEAMRKKLRNGKPNPDYIPAQVRREVFIRDGGSCQHQGEDGHVCHSTHKLEYDHKKPVAEGGESTADNVELVCQAHNQFRAKLVLGEDRVAAGRERTERERAEKRVQRAKEQVGARPTPPSSSGAPDHRADVEGGLVTTFRLRRSDARRIADEVCAAMPGASAEATMKAAIQRLAPARAVQALQAQRRELAMAATTREEALASVG